MDTSNIRGRILSLSSNFSTDKEFLDTCKIPDPTFVTNIRKGKNKNPKSAYLEKIVRGTGCSGTWLLTGEGEMFGPRRNQEEGTGQDPNIAYAFNLLERIEQQADAIKDAELPQDVELQLARLLVKVLERRSGRH